MKTTILIAFTVIGMNLFAVAQGDTRKFGHVNSQEILSLMPELDTVQRQVEAYQKQLTEEYLELQKEFDNAYAEYEKNANNWSEALRKAKEDDLRRKQQTLVETQQAFQEELNEKQQRLMAPLIEKLDAAVKAVAKEKGLNYVYDTGYGSFLVVDDADNIAADVKKKLGIK